MSTEEKKKLSAALTSLSPEDLDKALLIVSQDYPSFHATSQEVDLDIDSLVLFVRFNIWYWKTILIVDSCVSDGVILCRVNLHCGN